MAGRNAQVNRRAGDDAGPHGTRLTVERMLPVLPMMQDSSEVWKPSDQTRAALMARLKEELDHRGQAIPSIPEQPPQPTRGSIRRAERMAVIARQQAQQQQSAN